MYIALTMDSRITVAFHPLDEPIASECHDYGQYLENRSIWIKGVKFYKFKDDNNLETTIEYVSSELRKSGRVFAKEIISPIIVKCVKLIDSGDTKVAIFEEPKIIKETLLDEIDEVIKWARVPNMSDKDIKAKIQSLFIIKRR